MCSGKVRLVTWSTHCRWSIRFTRHVCYQVAVHQWYDRFWRQWGRLNAASCMVMFTENMSNILSDGNDSVYPVVFVTTCVTCICHHNFLSLSWGLTYIDSSGLWLSTQCPGYKLRNVPAWLVCTVCYQYRFVLKKIKSSPVCTCMFQLW